MKFKPSLLILVTLLLNTAGCADGVDSDKDACTPEANMKFCDRLGKNCDIVTGSDNCGSDRTVSCGTCTAPETCGGSGTPNVCGEGTCTPTTCAAEGKNCGTISDGCSGILDCGTCIAPETCGGGGTANVCGEGTCTPTTCAAEGKNCGTISDGCSGILDCGTCIAPETCGGGGTANVCGEGTCTPTTCAAEGKNCGTISDGCNGTLDCGTCIAPETCGGGGTANVCGDGTCTPDCTGLCGGSDGCGGTCPHGCSVGQVCNAVTWQCVMPTPGIWVFVEVGTFTMGSLDTEEGHFPDENQHEVTLTHNFEILSSEVTQQQFDTLMGWNPSYFGPNGEGAECGPSCPVEFVSWFDVVAYTNELSLQEGGTPCYVLSDVVCWDNTTVDPDTDYLKCMNAAQLGIKSAIVDLNGVASVYECTGFRLPTEAEWEYAARGGDQRATYNGELPVGSIWCEKPHATLDPIAWFCGNSNEKPHEVGGLAANDYGLYDMLGNVWEWCHDWYGNLAGPVTDPWGPAISGQRVWRGCSWYGSAGSARAAARFRYSPGFRRHHVGMRPVRSSP